MNYITECENSHDFVCLLEKYGLTPVEWYKLKYEWDFLDPSDQMEIDDIWYKYTKKNIEK